jgi:hypothetical protein
VLAEHVWPPLQPLGPFAPGSQNSDLVRPVHVGAHDTLYVVPNPVISVEQHTSPVVQSALDVQRTVEPRHVAADPHDAVETRPPVMQQTSVPWQ